MYFENGNDRFMILDFENGEGSSDIWKKEGAELIEEKHALMHDGYTYSFYNIKKQNGDFRHIYEHTNARSDGSVVMVTDGYSNGVNRAKVEKLERFDDNACKLSDKEFSKIYKVV